MDLQKIKQICASQTVTISQLAEQIGVSEPGIYQSIRTGSMKVETLEKICKYLKVNPATFFDFHDFTGEMEADYYKSKELRSQIDELNNLLDHYRILLKKQ